MKEVFEKELVEIWLERRRGTGKMAARDKSIPKTSGSNRLSGKYRLRRLARFSWHRNFTEAIMMSIKDPFSYSSRWDSIGIDCSHCIHFSGPPEWPDTKKLSRCKLHGYSLAFELASNGYKEGEWFCKHFDGESVPKAIHEFDSILGQMEDGVVYGGYGKDGLLKGIIGELRAQKE